MTLYISTESGESIQPNSRFSDDHTTIWWRTRDACMSRIVLRVDTNVPVPQNIDGDVSPKPSMWYAFIQTRDPAVVLTLQSSSGKETTLLANCSCKRREKLTRGITATHLSCPMATIAQQQQVHKAAALGGQDEKLFHGRAVIATSHLTRGPAETTRATTCILYRENSGPGRTKSNPILLRYLVAVPVTCRQRL